METMEIKYRTWFKGKPPQKIKLQIPGWAGRPGYKDGCEAQPWHCKPFVDASTYGLELIYPFHNELIVNTSEDNVVTFNGEFTEEELATGVNMPPFMSFAPNHYGFTSSIDIKTPPGIITRIEPHPSYYTDRTGTVPLPVAGHLETEWWSRIFFIAFSAPLPGRCHVFKPGQPYAQLLFLPQSLDYDIKHMTVEENSQRLVRDQNINKHGSKLCSRHFNDANGSRFDNKYKQMSKINSRKGENGVDEYIEDVIGKSTNPTKKIAAFRLKKSKPQD